MPSIRIVQKGLNGQHVEVDGQDISKAVRGVTLWMPAREVPQLDIELAVYGDAEIDADVARVVIADETRKLLRAAGWIPPARAFVVNGVPHKPEDVQIVTDEEQG